MKRRHNIVTGMSLCFVLLATLGTSAKAASAISPAETLARVGGMLCAPVAAMAAEKQIIENAPLPDSAALPVAQTIDENDYSSGFWTEVPTKEELLPLPTTEMPQGAAPVLSAHYAQGTTKIYSPCGNATVKNCTDLPQSEVAAEILQEMPFAIEPNSALPQVLIMHTHATEAYQPTPEPWCNPEYTARSTDMAQNVTAVGAAMAGELNAMGVNTIQDTTLHDYPSYNGSYARSNKTVRKYLEQYPSIKVVLDVHRDAIQKDDGTRIKPICDINGEQAAQVMIICGADNKGNLPNFKQNLRFASHWQSKIEGLYPGITRPLLFDYRYYNQDLTTGSLLIEVGGHANTLQEATMAGAMAAKALAQLLLAAP
ncbi:MAG: stage II sporulation protein P [Oscillospiraceae bacterium]